MNEIHKMHGGKTKKNRIRGKRKKKRKERKDENELMARGSRNGGK